MVKNKLFPVEKVIPAHTSSASDPHRFRLGHGFPCAFSSFGPKVKMPLALGNEKKTFWALKSLLFIQTYSNTLTFRAKQRQLLEAQKGFSFFNHLQLDPEPSEATSSVS